MSSSFFAANIRHLPARNIARTTHAVHPSRLPRACASRRAAAREPLRLPRQAVQGTPARRAVASVTSLGAASAGPVHAWALPQPATMPARAVHLALPHEAAVVRIPLELIQAMRRTAFVEGRDEAAVWADAAREWLADRARDDEPQPPTPAAGALPCPRAASAWAAIDAVLEDLGAARNAGHPGRVA